MARSPVDSYLKKHPRSPNFWYQRDVPQDCRAAIGLTRWKRSLETATKGEAIKRAHALSVEHTRLIEECRKPRVDPLAHLTPEQRQRIEAMGGVDGFLEHLDDNAREASRLQREALQSKELVRSILTPSAQDPSAFDKAGATFWQGVQSLPDEVDVPRTRAMVAGFEAISRVLTEDIAGDATMVQSLQAVLPSPLDSTFPALAAALDAAPSPPDRATLADVLKAWEGARKPRSPEQYRHPIKLFETLHGSLPVVQITPAHVRRFREHLDGMPDLKRSTAEKHLRCVRTILQFALENGYREGNPAQGIRFYQERKKAVEKKVEGRRTFSPDELTRLLQVADGLLSGSIRRPGKRTMDDDRDTAWFVRLAVYTGARGEELAQLSPGDLKQERNIPYLSIHDEGDNKLKNDSSLRIVPVHPRLIDLGFLEFVKTRKGKQRLFYTLKADGRDRLYMRMGHRLTNIIRGHLKIDDKRVTPHSLRHTMKDAFRAAGVQKEITDRILGHTGSVRDQGERYGEGETLETLAEQMAKVDPLDKRRRVRVEDHAGVAKPEVSML